MVPHNPENSSFAYLLIRLGNGRKDYCDTRRHRKCHGKGDERGEIHNDRKEVRQFELMVEFRDCQLKGEKNEENQPTFNSIME